MGKVNGCIICNCEWAEQVNEKLTNNVPYSKIVEFLAKKGIPISDSSVWRHKKKHLLNEGIPKQLQKEAIRATKHRLKELAKKNTQQPEQRGVQTPLLVDILDDYDDIDPELSKKEKRFRNELAKLTADFDYINEMVYTIAVAKTRMHRAVEEERENDMVLSTTGKAIKDYAELVKDFKDMMAGSDSIQKMRFTQLVTMVTEIFGSVKLTDKTRYELFSIMGTNEELTPEQCIRP